MEYALSVTHISIVAPRPSFGKMSVPRLTWLEPFAPPVRRIAPFVHVTLPTVVASAPPSGSASDAPSNVQRCASVSETSFAFVAARSGLANVKSPFPSVSNVPP